MSVVHGFIFLLRHDDSACRLTSGYQHTMYKNLLSVFSSFHDSVLTNRNTIFNVNTINKYCLIIDS